jgi:MFS family permease
MLTRALAAIAICPCAGIGGGVATELYFAHERARRIGWWTLTVSVGPPLAPLVMGWVVDRAGPEWVFWVLAIVNFGQFLAYLTLNAESKYPEWHLTTSNNDETSMSVTKNQSRLSFRRLNDAPWTLRELYSCFLVLRHLDVAVVIFTITIMFAFVNISMILEIPSVLGEKFELTGGQIGLQCLGPIIGAFIGEQVEGPLSDLIIRQRFKCTGRRNYSNRLSLTYLAWPAAVAGTVIFYVQTQRAHHGQWNVTPLIGAGIAWFGSQIVLTTMITFAVDSHREVATDITLLSNVTRHVWAFVSSSTASLSC